MMPYVFAPMVAGSMIIDAASGKLSATFILLTSMLIINTVSRNTKQ